jgi:5-methylcytosine-specific restriction endonuclease McrA
VLTPFQRQVVAAGQQWRCNHCSVLFGPLWHVDHVVPLADGGDDASSNMQALCAVCHAIKTADENQRRRKTIKPAVCW